MPTDDDLHISLTRARDGTVLINFGQPVYGFALSPSQANTLALIILDLALKPDNLQTIGPA